MTTQVEEGVEQVTSEVMAGGGSRDFGRHGVDDRAAVLILETWCREQAG